jgi:Rrf2 family protein
MKLLSDTTEYALRTVMWLSRDPASGQTTKQIAQGTGIPGDYQSKVIQLLASKGIVHSKRGIGGGVRIIVSPEDCTVLDIVEAVDPIQKIQTCPLGLNNAHGICLCPFHQGLNEAADQLKAGLAKLRIADLLEPAHQCHLEY